MKRRRIVVDRQGHLASESLDDLHDFARRIGLRRHWFHNKRGRNHPHYDLTTERVIARAIKGGAKLVRSRTILIVAQGTAVQGSERSL